MIRVTDIVYPPGVLRVSEAMERKVYTLDHKPLPQDQLAKLRKLIKLRELIDLLPATHQRQAC